jgi:4'-phosphopantetheinyl transferase
MAHPSIEIFWIEPQNVAAESAIRCLTEQEQLRASRFHFKADALNWIACRASLRQILAVKLDLPAIEVPIVYQCFGKPTLTPEFGSLHFNLSHCSGLALIAICEASEVGIDLELRTRGNDLLGCESSFCHPNEIPSLPKDSTKRAARLLKIWTSKEALLKARGTGLSAPPELFEIHFNPTSTTVISHSVQEQISDLKIYSIHHPRFTDYSVALASRLLEPKLLIQNF